MRGAFITLEGGEGAGKSTLARALLERLQARGLDVIATREPGGTALAEAVRTLLLSPPAGDWNPLAEILLFNAARVEHLETLIRPHLARGGWVVCDRFSDSTLAYQSALDPALREPILQLDRLCVSDTRPDLTFLLDLPPEAARERIAARGLDSDAIDRRPAEYHARVRQIFLDIAASDPRRCLMLDATQDAQSLAAQAFAAVCERLPVNAVAS